MPAIRPAQATLNEIRGGELLVELAAAIHDAANAVVDHSKKATITITLEIDIPKNMKGMAEPYLVVSGEITTKLPKPDTPLTIFGVDTDGNLTRNLSRSQNDLPFTIAGQQEREN